jgi:hypothetical protein
MPAGPDSASVQLISEIVGKSAASQRLTANIGLYTMSRFNGQRQGTVGVYVCGTHLKRRGSQISLGQWSARSTYKSKRNLKYVNG